VKAALDTNAVILLGEQDPKTVKLITLLQQLEFELIIPPNVQNELDALETRGTAEEQRKAALAIRAIISYNLATPGIRPMHQRFIEQTAEKFLRQGVIKKQEKNDAFILVEAAFLRCPILFSIDRHMKTANRNLGYYLLKEYRLHFPKVEDPRKQVIGI
jgi:rRNA-processing protein FCF1